MSENEEVKYAVVYFWLEQGILISEVWYDNLTLKEAEEIRFADLNGDPDIEPQMLQVIQYNT